MVSTIRTIQKTGVETAENRRECSVEFFVRSSSPTGARAQQERVVERLDELQRDERIASYTVTVWGGGIAPESSIARTETGRAILDTVDEFTSWASRHDLSFPSAFEERETTSMVDNECQTMIPFPTMCLAVREDGNL